MEKDKVKQLGAKATLIRRKALEAVYAAKSGHIGGSFSMADILAVLYFDKMNIDPENLKAPGRDRFVLSKGHCTPTMYSTLALRGYFPVEDLQTFRGIDSYLSGHVEMTKVPGIDMSAGSLGQGLSAAVGMAVVGKIDKADYRVFAALGDGEIQEGQIWEATMAAGNYGLDNLTVFVDNNKLQIDGTVEEVMSPYPIEDKFKAFKWNVLTIDGHDYEEIADAIDKAGTMKGAPTVIVANTVKGKGVSFLENDVKWHGSIPSEEQFKQAFDELDASIAAWEA